MTHTMTTTTARRRFTRILGPITGLAFGLAGAMLISPVGAEPAPAADDVLMQALVDELGRSMTLQLGDLQAPYFVQYHVQETETYQMAATYGAIVTSDDASSRRLATDVRVGYYDVDNTNFAAGGAGGGFGGRRGRGGGGGGGMAMLPTEDGYDAIRQAAWLATDAAYKSSVETFTAKQTYLQQQHDAEARPHDFARATPAVVIEPKVRLAVDVPAWEDRLRRVSARFMDHPAVIDSSVSLTATAETRYLINSEGSRIRTGDTGVVLTIVAEAMAGDGEALSERRTFHAASADTLPPVETLVEAVDALATRLTERAAAPILESYLGPVLFDGAASAQLFDAMLSRGVAGEPTPVGGGRRRMADATSLDKYLGKRILPRGFRVYDDPRAATVHGAFAAGHYTLDDEGVPARRVDLVVDGRLENMLMSRVPTDRFDESNGHGRAMGPGRIQASTGCLYIEADEGVDDDTLVRELIDAAKAQGLEYGLRITAIEGGGRAGGGPGGRGGGRGGFAGGGGGGASVGDPVAVYRVYLDGTQELVRGCEFGSLDLGALKDIVAAGRSVTVANTGSPLGAPSTIIAPAVLIEEVELFPIEEERRQAPLIGAPHQRPKG